MGLTTYEESESRGVPVELYYFRYGSAPGAFFAYTDSEFTVEHNGVSYTPLPLKRGQITAQQSLDKSEMKVKTNTDNGVAELFRLYPPSSPVILTIRAGHRLDPESDYAVVWVGRVQSCSRTKGEAELSCVPASSSIRRSGLRRHYQLTCPHVLYDDTTCRADVASATRTGVVVLTVSYTSLVMPPGWNGTPPPEKYVGGVVEWDGSAGREVRTILRIEGDQLHLGAPTKDLLSGVSTVDIKLGCNHQIEDCTDLHNNIVNFGGMPYIPQVNPVKTNPFN